MLSFQEEVEQENQKQRQLFADLIAAIEKQLSRLKLQLRLYGSFGTGLMMSHSDINLIAVPSGECDLPEIMHDIEL
jgi:DNA polymerase sigma